MGAIAIAVGMCSLLFVAYSLYHAISLCRKAFWIGAEFEATIGVPSFGLTIRTAPGRRHLGAGERDRYGEDGPASEERARSRTEI